MMKARVSRFFAPVESGPQLTDGRASTPAVGVPESPLPRVLTIKEAALALGVNRKTLLLAVQRGAVPGVRRVGRSYRISAEVLFGWLAKGRG
jgi:excisionase family DNA binding protein